jgi:hypothetical protein
MFEVIREAASVEIWRDGQKVGDVFESVGCWTAVHDLRGEGAVFTAERLAIEYVCGLDLLIDGMFDGLEIKELAAV